MENAEKFKIYLAVMRYEAIGTGINFRLRNNSRAGSRLFIELDSCSKKGSRTKELFIFLYASVLARSRRRNPARTLTERFEIPGKEFTGTIYYSDQDSTITELRKISPKRDYVSVKDSSRQRRGCKAASRQI